MEGWKTRVTGERCNDHGIKEVLFADPDLSQEPMFYRKVSKSDFTILLKIRKDFQLVRE